MTVDLLNYERLINDLTSTNNTEKKFPFCR